MQEKQNINIKLALVIRQATVAPVFALLFTVAICVFSNLGSAKFFWLSLIFLCLMPLAAYPVYRFLPFFKNRTRHKERTFAIITATLGYILAVLFAFILKADAFTLAVFLTYLISGLLIAVSSFVIKVKASGHACGVAGPIAVLYYVFGNAALWLLALVPAVIWSSLKLKRHTAAQLIAGFIIPVFVFRLIKLLIL